MSEEEQRIKDFKDKLLGDLQIGSDDLESTSSTDDTSKSKKRKRDSSDSSELPPVRKKRRKKRKKIPIKDFEKEVKPKKKLKRTVLKEDIIQWINERLSKKITKSSFATYDIFAIVDAYEEMPEGRTKGWHNPAWIALLKDITSSRIRKGENELGTSIKVRKPANIDSKDLLVSFLRDLFIEKIFRDETGNFQINALEFSVQRPFLQDAIYERIRDLGLPGAERLVQYMHTPPYIMDVEKNKHMLKKDGIEQVQFNKRL